MKPTRTDWVGIGKSTTDPRFVEYADEPHPSMTPSLKFMAKRLGLRHPPTPCKTKADHLIRKQWSASLTTKPKQEDFERLMTLHKARSNGIDVFPKTLSMVQSELEKDKGRDAVKHAKSIMKEEHNSIMRSLRQQRAPAPTVSNKALTMSPKLNDDEKVSGIHVPPVQAPHQARDVPSTQQKTRKCACRDLGCKLMAWQCNGWTRATCKCYGKEASQIKKSNVGKKKVLDECRQCAWIGLCTARASVCGGYNKSSCKFFGTNGILKQPAEHAKEENQLKRKRNNKMKAVRKRRKAVIAAVKAAIPDPNRGRLLNGNQHWEVLLDSVNTQVLVDEKEYTYIIGGTDILRLPYGVTINSADVSDMLRVGALIDDNVVQGYYNLLRQRFSGLGVRVVNTNFFSTLQQNSWNNVARWVKEVEGVESGTWETARTILVPIFSGSNTGGHWSNFLVDRSFQGEATSTRELLVCADSLQPDNMSQSLRKELVGTPLCPERPNVEWVVSPRTGQGPNDCAVHSCVKAAAYLKALEKRSLCAYRKDIVKPKVSFSFSGKLTLEEWGQLGRRHLLNSLCCGKIDMDDFVINETVVSVSLPETHEL